MRAEITRRDLFKRTLATSMVPGFLAGTGRIAFAAPENPATDAPWFRTCLVGIEWGPTGGNDKDDIYLSKASGDQIVGMAAKADAEYIVVFMKDMRFAYYNSKLAQKCPNLGDRDLLQECIDAARPIGMPVIAYCQVQYDGSSWDAHPEWRMVDAHGKELSPRLCYRSGYLDYIRGLLGEMMQYDIHGFHVDMLDFGFHDEHGCWCDRCRQLFEKQYGYPMPDEFTWDDHWQDVLDFRYESNLAFCHTLDQFVHETRPDISVDYNYHGYPPFSWETGERPVSHAASGDFVTAEGLPFIFGHTNPSLLALFLKAARPGGPVQIATSRSIYNYHDFTVRPAADLTWEVMTYMAHGVQCTVVDKADYDGGLDHVVYERLGIAFREAKRKRAYTGQEPVREVGVYYSLRSRDWYGRDNNPKYMRAVWGAHKALVESHIPIAFILDEDVSLERLKRFPVVYLPGTAIVTPDEVTLLKEYVEGGGKLLLTGACGWYGLHGDLQERSALEDLIGARMVTVNVDHPDNFIRFAGDHDESFNSITDGIPTDWLMMNWGPVAAYEPAGASAIGEAFVAYRSQDNDWSNHMSAGPAIGPAVLVNQLGDGTVVGVAVAPDVAFAGDYRMPEHRKLLRNLVRFLHPKPAIQIEAPPHVEAVVTQDDGRILVHLLFFAGPPTSATDAFPTGRKILPTVMEEPLPYVAEIKVATPIRRASSVNGDSELVVDGTRVRIHANTVHDIVVIEL